MRVPARRGKRAQPLLWRRAGMPGRLITMDSRLFLPPNLAYWTGKNNI